jgi:hypothetical protein
MLGAPRSGVSGAKDLLLPSPSADHKSNVIPSDQREPRNLQLLFLNHPPIPGAPSMTQFHRAMGGKARTHPSALSSRTTPGTAKIAIELFLAMSFFSDVIPSDQREPRNLQLLFLNHPPIQGAPSMTQFHRVMGGKARTPITTHSAASPAAPALVPALSCSLDSYPSDPRPRA